MSMLDWEKRKYDRAIKAIEERRALLMQEARDAAERLAHAIAYEQNFKTPEDDSQAAVAAARSTFEAALAAASKPPFKVYVRPQRASNGLTYFVILDRTDRPANSPPIPSEGYLTPINRHDIEEANGEGYVWSALLGVPFEPCKPIKDTAKVNTVPEYGGQQAADLMKLVDDYKDYCVKQATMPGGYADGAQPKILRWKLEEALTLACLRVEPKETTE